MSVVGSKERTVRQRQVEGARMKIFELVKEKGQDFDMNNDFYFILEGLFSKYYGCKINQDRQLLDGHNFFIFLINLKFEGL